MLHISADHHFSNINIIKHCNRNYLDRNEMDYGMMSNHNKRVDKSDDFIFVGDYCLASKWNNLRHTSILNNLNGRRKILILGNHDGTAAKMRAMGFTSVYNTLTLGNMYFTHKPQDAIKDPAADGKIIITGHCHNNTPRFYTFRGKKIVNIGVDLWDFKPVSTIQLLREYAIAKFPDITKQFEKYEHKKRRHK